MSPRDIFAEQGEALARRQTVIDSLDKAFYSVDEAAQLLTRRKQDVYAMIEAGELDIVQVGKKREKRVPKAEIARVLVPAPFDFIRKILRGRPE